MKLVTERTGLAFPPGRRESAEAGIRRVMVRSGITQPARFVERIAAVPGAMDELVAELTVGETYFFREAEQLEFIRGEVLPELVRSRGVGAHLRAWSAGCASGEEAHTLAILLHEAGVPAHVIGTDISRERLSRARLGRYARWSLRGVPDAAVQRYFAHRADAYELLPEIRTATEFRYLNLAEDVYPSLGTGIWGMDLVLCRNVLIYLDAQTVTMVARRLMDSLAPEGWLFLGAADPPLRALVPCEVMLTTAGVAYRRPRQRKVRPAAAPKAAALPSRPARPPREPRAVRTTEVLPASGAAGAEMAGAVDLEAVRERYAARDYAAAAELARRRIQQEGTESEAWIVFVRSLANQGKLAEAGRACAAALGQHRCSAELTYLQALLLAEAGHLRDSAAAARRALYLDRTLVVAHLALGSALARLDDPMGASRAFRNAERLLAATPPHEIVPASDGEPSGSLADMTRVQLRLLLTNA